MNREKRAPSVFSPGSLRPISPSVSLARLVPSRTPITSGLLLLLLAHPPTRATAQEDLAPRLDSLFAGRPHAAFEWVQAEGVSDRAAMRIPVHLDGTEGWFQLDTGLDVTLVYGELPVERGWATNEGFHLAPSFDLGGIPLGPTWMLAREEMKSKGQMLGSIGLDLLVGQLVLIDYPGRRLALLRPGEAPLWLRQRTTWTPASLRDAKLFLTVVVGDRTLHGLFFDTGSSAFHVTVDLETWKELTGRAGPEEAAVRWKVSSWGKEILALGAPARGPLVIGSARIAEPQVFYLREQPNLFRQWPFPADGLVGSAPFWDRVVVLDLGIRPRFGLLQ